VSGGGGGWKKEERKKKGSLFCGERQDAQMPLRKRKKIGEFENGFTPTDHIGSSDRKKEQASTPPTSATLLSSMARIYRCPHYFEPDLVRST
jgi:hypothetical protein